MIRLEIIANRSVQDDVSQALTEKIPDFQYTMIPLVHGKGGDNFKMGSPTWPETNFVLFSWLADETEGAIRETLEAIKLQYPREGIRYFMQKTQLL